MSTQPTRHVLVADDEPHIGRIIKMKLEQGPFEVSLAYDGREALEMLAQHDDVSLVILDLMMPHLSGLDVLAAIREDPRWHDLPCIILTAAGQEQQHTRAMEPGRDRFSHQALQPKTALRASGRNWPGCQRRKRRPARREYLDRHSRGGVGSRFWPLSTPVRPKQLLPLASARPLLLDTVERLRPLADASRMLILTNASLVDSIVELLPGLASNAHHRRAKPAGTAAALTWAAQEITRRDGPGAIMVSVHADWAIGDDDGFRDTLNRAVAVAEWTTTRSSPSVSCRRDPIPGSDTSSLGPEIADGVRRVARFVEKPDRGRVPS